MLKSQGFAGKGAFVVLIQKTGRAFPKTHHVRMRTTVCIWDCRRLKTIISLVATELSPRSQSKPNFLSPSIAFWFIAG